MKIAIGNDHTATELKNTIVDYLNTLGIEVVNFGTDTNERTDYPLFAEKVTQSVQAKDVAFGILICGTGIGMSIAANKQKGIRACVCSEPYSAKASREHNDANVLCFGARVVGPEVAKMIVEHFIEADYHGDRHQRRVDMLNNYIE